MKITKAIISAAGSDQRKLPLQTLIDRDRKKKTVLEILIDEISSAGVNEIGVVIPPGDKGHFEQALGDEYDNIEFIPQVNPNGYGHSLLAARQFVDNEPFLHLVGDHLYINRSGENIAQRVIETADRHNCPVSAVQPTRESSIINFGTVGGVRLQGQNHLYQISRVMEKPTPTYAEQHLMISGMHTGYYLCFFGMHVFTPQLLEILQLNADKAPGEKLGLSESLNELAKHSKYLALEMDSIRYDLGQDYGLLKAQLALSLSGKDRDLVLSELMQFFIEREKLKNEGY